MASWVLPIIGSSLISRTDNFQSSLAQLPPPSYRHLVVFHKALSWVLFFSQSMSHLWFQLFPLKVSINSSMPTIHNSFSSFLQIRFISFRFGNELILNWLPLFTVISLTPALNICYLYYTPTPWHVRLVLLCKHFWPLTNQSMRFWFTFTCWF